MFFFANSELKDASLPQLITVPVIFQEPLEMGTGTYPIGHDPASSGWLDGIFFQNFDKMGFVKHIPNP